MYYWLQVKPPFYSESLKVYSNCDSFIITASDDLLNYRKSSSIDPIFTAGMFITSLISNMTNNLNRQIDWSITNCAISNKYNFLKFDYFKF